MEVQRSFISLHFTAFLFTMLLRLRGIVVSSCCGPSPPAHWFHFRSFLVTARHSTALHPHRNVQSSHDKGFSETRDVLLVIGVGHREAKSCKVMYFVKQQVRCQLVHRRWTSGLPHGCFAFHFSFCLHVLREMNAPNLQLLARDICI